MMKILYGMMILGSVFGFLYWVGRDIEPVEGG